MPKAKRQAGELTNRVKVGDKVSLDDWPEQGDHRDLVVTGIIRGNSKPPRGHR